MRPIVGRVKLVFGIMVAVTLVAAPHLGLPSYALSLMIEALFLAIFAMSLDVLVGYLGLVSLGHATFFAIGAYATGIIANGLTNDILVTSSIGLAVAGVLGIVIGWLSIRLPGFYFLMITLAFAQMIYSIADKWNWLTGGSNGMSIPSPALFGHPVLNSREQIYYVVLVAFGLSWFILHRVVTSPFGEALVGIRENTRRMRAIGYNVRRYKLVGFVIAAIFASLAGILNAQFNHFVSPENAHWSQSANVLVMVLIGGAGTLLGPVIGATVVLLLQNWLSSYTEYWSLALGILFIVLITGARDGILGLMTQAWRKIRGK